MVQYDLIWIKGLKIEEMTVTVNLLIVVILPWL